jgi:hypothetical protein
MRIADFEAEIDRRITIDRVLETVRLLVEEESSAHCTYATYLPSYVRLKGNRGWLGRDECLPYDKWRDKMNDLSARIKSLHHRMYLHPCFVCSTCKERKKLWKLPM